MATGLIDIMKRAALEVVETNQMCDLRVGTVISVSPLSVQVTSLFTIPEALLIVPQHLTDYKVEVDIDWDTETASEHDHSITGTKTMTVRGALKLGDKVALIRKTGGQSYFILDRF